MGEATAYCKNGSEVEPEPPVQKISYKSRIPAQVSDSLIAKLFSWGFAEVLKLTLMLKLTLISKLTLKVHLKCINYLQLEANLGMNFSLNLLY